jgi:AcrR family transcriptional regulator
MEIREQRKAQIMEAALELFANKGFHSTSVADISKMAGISKGLLYNYFESKEALIKELIMHGFDELMSVFDPNSDGILTGEEMKYLTIELLEVIKGDIQFWKLYFAILTQPPIYSLIEEGIMKKAEPIFTVIGTYFEHEGYENPMVEARLFTAMLDGITMNFVFDPENFPIEHVRDRFLSLYNLD